MRRFLLTAIIFLILIIPIWAIFIEPNMLFVNRVKFKIPNWPESRKGYKILFVGDLHTGSPFNYEDKVKRIVKLANKENIDIVLSVGDYVVSGVVGGKYLPAEVSAKILSGIKSKQGFITVLGNHDWWEGGFQPRKN